MTLPSAASVGISVKFRIRNSGSVFRLSGVPGASCSQRGRFLGWPADCQLFPGSRGFATRYFGAHSRVGGGNQLRGPAFLDDVFGSSEGGPGQKRGAKLGRRRWQSEGGVLRTTCPQVGRFRIGWRIFDFPGVGRVGILDFGISTTSIVVEIPLSDNVHGRGKYFRGASFSGLAVRCFGGRSGRNGVRNSIILGGRR